MPDVSPLSLYASSHANFPSALLPSYVLDFFPQPPSLPPPTRWRWRRVVRRAPSPSFTSFPWKARALRVRPCISQPPQPPLPHSCAPSSREFSPPQPPSFHPTVRRHRCRRGGRPGCCRLGYSEEWRHRRRRGRRRLARRHAHFRGHSRPMDEDWYRGDGYGAAVYTVAAVLRGLSDGGASGGVGGHEDASSTRAAAAAAATSPPCITRAAAHWQMGCPPGDFRRPSARGPAGGLAPVAACGCTDDGGWWYVSTFTPLAVIGGATPAPLPDILPRGRSSPDADPFREPAQPGGGRVHRRAPNGGRYGRRGF